MPSIALNRWQTDRMPRLDRVDAHCAAFLGTPAPVPEMGEEALQGYVMLLSGHFQGFCRDLYKECSRAVISTLPAELEEALLVQFSAELKLDSGNPTIENLRKDFERFGASLNLPGADPPTLRESRTSAA